MTEITHSFLFWVFLTYGLTFGVKDSKLSFPIRKFLARSSFLKDLLTCSFCTGFWCGLVSGAMLGGVWLEILASGFAGAALSYAAELALAKLEPDDDG